MDRIPAFDSQQLTAICKVLGDPVKGLTDSEINFFLSDSKIPNVSPDLTKWKRLFDAFQDWQSQKQLGNHVLMFVNRAMNKAQYASNPELFSARREHLNEALVLCGLAVGEDGKVVRSAPWRSASEAMVRAQRLNRALASRKVHEEIFIFCRAEMLDENYFRAVFEAVRNTALRIRKMSGLQSDGVELAHEAFGFEAGKPPVLAINNLLTEAEEAEQRGFLNMLAGVLGTVRNPAAHTPNVEWDMSEQDTVDVLTAISFVHRKLDLAYRYEKSVSKIYARGA